MEISLFNLMTHPTNGVSHKQVYAQTRDMTIMADQAGFDIAWFAEHHLSNYCISPSPLLCCANIAAQTSNIKVGPAVIVMPFYEPLRLVEDICLTDQLTDGRLVLGLGTGYQPREFQKFGFDIDNRLQRGLEVWDVIDQGLTNGVVNYSGQHIKIDDAALSVAPLQKNIATFAVGNAPEMRQRMVDRKATPMTTPALGPASLMTTARNLFIETRQQNGLDGDDFPFAVQRYVYVAANKQDAKMAAEQILVHARMAANMRSQEPQIDGATLKNVPFENEPTIEQILQRAIIGDAREVAEKIATEVSEYSITHLSVFMQIAGIPYDKAMQSFDRFCERVLPDIR